MSASDTVIPPLIIRRTEQRPDARGGTRGSKEPGAGDRQADRHRPDGRREAMSIGRSTRRREAFPVWSAMDRGGAWAHPHPRCASAARSASWSWHDSKSPTPAKPIAEAPEGPISARPADCFEYFGGLAAGIKGDHYDLGGNFAYTRREPWGVVGGIGRVELPDPDRQLEGRGRRSPAATPWSSSVRDDPPVTAIKLAEITDRSGAAGRRVQRGSRRQERAGHAIASHPRHRQKVSLTGSVPTGAQGDGRPPPIR